MGVFSDFVCFHFCVIIAVIFMICVVIVIGMLCVIGMIMIVAVFGFCLLFFAMVVIVIMCAAFVEEQCAWGFHQRDTGCIGGHFCFGVAEPWRHERAYPDQKISILQPSGLGGAQGVIMGRCSCWCEEFRCAEIAHDLGGEAMQGWDVSDNAQGICGEGCCEKGGCGDQIF